MTGADQGIRLLLEAPRRTAEIGRARHAVRDAVKDVLPTEAMSEMTLVVGELLDNAVRHGVGDSFEVVVAVTDVVTITVSNSCGRVRPPPVDVWTIAPPSAPSGRGLGIVRRLAPRSSAVTVADTVTISVTWPH